MSVWDRWDRFSCSSYAHMCMAFMRKACPICPLPSSGPTFEESTHDQKVHP
jgi:hypothetical protein